MAISAMLESMWMRVFDNSLLSSLAIMAAFAYLCFKKRLGIVETLMVCFPVLIGVSTVGCFGTAAPGYGCLPPYFSGSVVMIIGLLWGLAICKALNSQEPYIKLYALFLCMNAALFIYDYHLLPYEYSNTGTNANLLNESTASSGAGTGIMNLIVPSYLVQRFSFIFNFFFGGAIIGFATATQMPSWIVTLIAVPVQGMGFLIILPFINWFINILYLIVTGVLKSTVLR